jgi:hypothetical protein
VLEERRCLGALFDVQTTATSICFARQFCKFAAQYIEIFGFGAILPRAVFVALTQVVARQWLRIARL